MATESKNPAPQTLGLYVHVPFCRHVCPYCDFYKMELRNAPPALRRDFVDTVRSEWRLRAASLGNRALETVYFGGGTPSTLNPRAVAALLAELPPTQEAEITLEANPENLTEPRCHAWAAAGVNRLSIGAQSFSFTELYLLERRHGAETIRRAVSNARRAGIRSLNLDLMFALPGQSLALWRRNLEEALALAPDHVSFYGLTFHEGTPFESGRREGRLSPIDEETQARMYAVGAALLEAEGFEHYEISNFARPGHRSRHNQRYWRREDVVALGPGAHGNVGTRRWMNVEDLEAWHREVTEGALPDREVEAIDERTAAEEALFCALRTSDGIRCETWPQLYAATHRFAETLAPELRQAWFAEMHGCVRLTREGWLRSDAIVARIAGLLQ